MRLIQIIDFVSLHSIFSFLPWDFSYFSLSIFLGVAFTLVSVTNGIFCLIYSICLLFLHRENIDFFSQTTCTKRPRKIFLLIVIVL